MPSQDPPAPTHDHPRHPRWTPEGAPLDLDPASAAFMAAESIVRAALEAEETHYGRPCHYGGAFAVGRGRLHP